METREIAAVLQGIADYMEVRGENPFKVRSFRNGARAIEALGEDVAERVSEGTLAEVPGVGKALVEVITELIETGQSSRLAELRASVPAGLLDMVGIPGVGPKKAKLVYDRLKISDVEGLRAAAEDGLLVELPGFGEKTVVKILEGIAYRKTVSGRFLYIDGEHVAKSLVEHLRGASEVVRIELAGSLRRRRETIKDVDIVVSVRSAEDAGAVMDRFVAWEAVQRVIARGETKASVYLDGGLQVDLRVVDDACFPAALLYFTGSKEHNTALRGLAKEKGLKLNEYGLFRVQESADGEDTLLPCEDEAAIFAALRLDYIEPELRENLGEVEWARESALPKLLEVGDIRGIVHAHSTYSDGKNTIAEMAGAARERGFLYLGLTDHSQSAGYAGGLKKEAVLKQHEEIEALNEDLEEFRIFKGIESDIRMDGSLDYDDDVLDLFDFVIASVHSGFQLGESEQTERVIQALECPYTTFLAHPTGRLLLQRDGYAINMERVLEAAGELGVCVEINAHPKRLDLDWRLGNFARRHGVKTAIHPDAHNVNGLDHVIYGVGIARKAGFSKEDVVNTYDVEAFEEFIGRRRG